MSRRRLLLGVALLPLVPPVVLLWGLRTRNRTVVHAVRQLNRTVINPRNLATAGRPGSRYSVVRHRGRRSGREHVTPVGATREPRGFVVALPYGAGTDWVRNLRAAGGGTVVHDGRTFPVVRPQLVPAAAASGSFSRGERWVQRAFGIAEVLRLHDGEPG